MPKIKQDEFEKNFKEMVKNIIKEEDYIKKEDVKESMKNILNEIDILVSNRVKEHFIFICNYIIKLFTKNNQ